MDPVFEAAGALAVPPAVREVVLDHLASWRGEETGISTAWSERLSAGLSDADRATCRLALLTAFASHQVEESVVGEFRRYHPGDATLVRTVAWASFAAARTVGRRQGTAAHDGRRNHRAA